MDTTPMALYTSYLHDCISLCIQRWRTIVILSTTYLLTLSTVMGQNIDLIDPNKQVVDTANTVEDTIIKNAFLSLFKGKPGKAMLLGLVVPSGGQIYNKRWWKVPLALGIEGLLINNIYINQTQYTTYRDLVVEGLKNQIDPSLISAYRIRRDAYRQRSEYAWVVGIIGHLVIAMEAYVDRHLMTFDVSEDLSLMYRQYGASPFITINIPLNK